MLKIESGYKVIINQLRQFCVILYYVDTYLTLGSTSSKYTISEDGPAMSEDCLLKKSSMGEIYIYNF